MCVFLTLLCERDEREKGGDAVNTDVLQLERKEETLEFSIRLSWLEHNDGSRLYFCEF